MERRPDFDLTNPESFVAGTPHPLLRWLRHNAPISRISDQEGNLYVAEVSNGRAEKFHPRKGANPDFITGQPARGAWK